MITTVTFNPAIDKRYHIEDIKIGEVQRVVDVENTAGGKGINVSRVASILGEKVTGTGFLGGTNGQFIEEEISRMGIENRFLKINGVTRCCLAIIDGAGKQTEFLEPGPEIRQEDFESWLKIYNDLLSNTEIVTASGSLPRGLNANSYARIIQIAKERGIKVFLDTSGSALLEGVNAKPYFVKPNTDEISLITGKVINTEKDILKGIKYLNEKGVDFVTVSMGKAGSISGYKGIYYKAISPYINAVNSVGSGDSFTAGMAVAHYRRLDIIDSIRFAAACGAANAMENRTGYVRIENVERIFNDVKVVEFRES
ncbi:MAG: 1-phosphofructokinase [Clostridiales bacterium]|nr:1-phosphofructokinase [Clostridiales bacterium]